MKYNGMTNIKQHGNRQENMTCSPLNRLIKCPQAAKYLGISERKLWQLTKDKRMPAVKFDRVVRYDIADLDDFIAKAKGLA